MLRARVAIPVVVVILAIVAIVAFVATRGGTTMKPQAAASPSTATATPTAKLDTPTAVVLSGLQNSSVGLQAGGNYMTGTLGLVAQPAPPTVPPGSVYAVGPYPLYTAQLADGPGKELVLGYCQTCHSVTYITMQPPLPANTWAAEVNKMIQTYGAVIPDDAAKQIIAYLQSHYTPETRK